MAEWYTAKNPVRFQAMKFEGGAENAQKIVDWVNSYDEWTAIYCEPIESLNFAGASVTVPEQIQLMYGSNIMHVDPGEYLIVGHIGTDRFKTIFYRQKAETFEQEYKQVSEEKHDA